MSEIEEDRTKLRKEVRAARQALIVAFVGVLQTAPAEKRRAVAGVLLQSPLLKAAVNSEIEDLRLARLLDGVNIELE